MPVQQPSRQVKPVQFFNPVDPFAGKHPETWVVQSHSPNISNQRAQSLGDDGDELASEIYGGQASGTTEYRFVSGAQNAHIDLSNFHAGTVDHATGYHADSITISYSPTENPSISVSCHKHTHCETGIPRPENGDPSHGTPHRVAQVSVTRLPASFGCPNELREILGISNDVDLAIGITSFTYTCGVTHQDESGGTGGYLASDNRDGMETISVSFAGVPSADPNPGAGWNMTSKETPTNNSAVESASYTFEKHVPTAYPSSETQS